MSAGDVCQSTSCDTVRAGAFAPGLRSGKQIERIG